MTIEEAAALIDCKVVYRAPHVRASEPGEEGVITLVNSTYVFVQFGANAGSQATLPEQLSAVSSSGGPEHRTEISR